MSGESARAFLHKLDTDPGLRTQLFASGSENAEQVTVSGERLIELGKEQGFAFTLKELHAAFAEQGGSTSGELHDQELDAVAGGKVQHQDFVFKKLVDKSSPVLS
jgi:predicted ribosomally synthesized peptide with nif11-like leader